VYDSKTHLRFNDHQLQNKTPDNVTVEQWDKYDVLELSKQPYSANSSKPMILKAIRHGIFFEIVVLIIVYCSLVAD